MSENNFGFTGAVCAEIGGAHAAAIRVISDKAEARSCIRLLLEFFKGGVAKDTRTDREAGICRVAVKSSP
jgi:hypothetical protein